MIPTRYLDLADQLVSYSARLKKGDVVLFELTDTPMEMAKALIRSAIKVGALPLVDLRDSKVHREILSGLVPEQAKLINDLELHRMKRVDAYVAIRGNHNASETADVPGKKVSLYSNSQTPVRNYRLNHTRWCVLRWPTPSMAQGAGMSTEAFENLYFDVCNGIIALAILR